MTDENNPIVPPATAIALKYDGSNAPYVCATGKFELAEEIIALAEQHGIVLHQDVELTRLLSQLSLGEEIPFILYTAVAKVIAFAYMLNDKKPAGFKL